MLLVHFCLITFDLLLWGRLVEYYWVRICCYCMIVVFLMTCYTMFQPAIEMLISCVMNCNVRMGRTNIFHQLYKHSISYSTNIVLCTLQTLYCVLYKHWTVYSKSIILCTLQTFYLVLDKNSTICSTKILHNFIL